MARKFLTPIDLNNLELQNVKIQNLADNPAIATTGKIYFNTASSQLRVYNGSSWTNVGSNPTAGDGISVAGSTVSLDLATTSGLEVASGDGLRIDLQTTSGLTLEADGLKFVPGDGLEFKSGANNVRAKVKTDGGIGRTADGLEIDFATTSGLEVASGDGLRIDLGTEPGLELSASGLKVLLDNTSTTSGLTIGASGLKVDVATTSGLTFDSTGLKVGLAAISGLELSAMGLAAKAVTNGGIDVGISGLSVDLATTSGLEIEAGEGLRIDLEASSGLALSTSGLAVDLASGGGLYKPTGALAIQTAGGGGLTVTSSGIEIDFADTPGLEVVTSGVRVKLGTGLEFNIPTGAIDVDTDTIASKSYVDSVAQGLDIKDSVFVATTTAGTLATDFENGDTVGGKVLSTGKRILIKDQANPVENGIYVVQASGAPVRAADLAAGANAQGIFTFVEQGTNSGKGFVCANPSDVVGTGTLTFTQFSESTTLVAGNGIDINGSTVSVNKYDDSLEFSSGKLLVNLATTSGLETVSNDGLRIDLATSSGLELVAGGLKVDLATTSYLLLESDGLKVDTSSNGGIARTYRQVLTGSSTTYTVTHNFSTTHVVVQVMENSGSYATVEADVTRPNANDVQITFATAPSSSEYAVTVIG